MSLPKDDAALLSVNDAKALAAMIRGAGYKDTRITEQQIQEIRVPALALIGGDPRADVVLDEGAMPLSVLEARVDAWIAGQARADQP